MMQTSEINSQRMDLVRDPVASLVLELTRRYIQPRKIAVGRCKPGEPFVIETEEDAHDANDTQAPA